MRMQMSKLSEQWFDHHSQAKSKKPTKNKKKPIKITYISSPTMFKASNETEFRLIVQELTGKNSTVGDDDAIDQINNPFSNVGLNNIVQEQACDRFLPNNIYQGNTTQFKMGSEHTDGVFSYDNSTTSSLEMDGGFSWNDVASASFFGLQSSCIFG